MRDDRRPHGRRCLRRTRRRDACCVAKERIGLPVFHSRADGRGRAAGGTPRFVEEMGRSIVAKTTQRRNPLFATGSPRPGGRLPIARGPSALRRPRRRCSWAQHEPLLSYHDKEWGVPLHDDRRLFEFLVLEGMQAGLSWEIVLRRRTAFRRAFARFVPLKVAAFGSADIARLMTDASIIRNRAKIDAAIGNARGFLAVKKEFRSFDRYAWGFTDKNEFSKDLLRRGFRFVGPTIVESFMQAVGIRNDHERGCYRWSELAKAARERPRVS